MSPKSAYRKQPKPRDALRDNAHVEKKTTFAKQFDALIAKTLGGTSGSQNQLLAKQTDVGSSTVGTWRNEKLSTVPEIPNLAKVCRFLLRSGAPYPEVVEVFRCLYGEYLDAFGAAHEKHGFNDLPHRWIAINHSRPDIIWEPVGGADERDAKDAAKKHYEIENAEYVKAPTHATSTDVFAVTDSQDKPLLFLKRIRKTDKEGDAPLRRIHDAVASLPEKIFGDLTKSLIPRKPKGVDEKGARWVAQRKKGETVYTVAYDFAVGAYTGGDLLHFAGAYEEQLETVGRKLGELNKHLAATDAPWNAHESAPPDISHIGKQLDEAEKISIPTRGQYLIQRNLVWLRTQYADSQLAMKDCQPLSCSAVDLHPHNTFFRDRKCVLIFDFGVEKKWPEKATAAFAMHRFCREFVRQKLSFTENGVDGAENEVKLLKDAMDAFLLGYEKGRGDAGLPALIRKEGARWIIAMNLAKLGEVMNTLVYGGHDPYNRPEPVLYSELVKFLSMFSEAEECRKALGGG